MPTKRQNILAFFFKKKEKRPLWFSRFLKELETEEKQSNENQKRLGSVQRNLGKIAKTAGVEPDIHTDPDGNISVGFTDPKFSPKEPCLCRMAKEN